MPLTSEITPYNLQWPALYEAESVRLAGVFGTDILEIHHIGSTAVPELAAKPEIDVLIVVAVPGVVDMKAGAMQKLGYRRGGDLSPGHHFFKRDVNSVRSHKVHVCVIGHPKIAEMLTFRDYLRENAEARRGYESLKLRLEHENMSGIGEYLEGKAPFIRSIMAKITGS